MSLTERLTDERLAEIKRWYHDLPVVSETTAEIDALRAERDDLKRQTRLWWHWCSVVDRLPAECPPYREPTPG